NRQPWSSVTETQAPLTRIVDALALPAAHAKPITAAAMVPKIPKRIKTPDCRDKTIEITAL
ncbi:MAG TPA: hypothetical protein VG501_04815, partial [Rhizomicrobium sp.]|nr:hypothetical protein [Rhizomicrobium sp.]